MHLHYVLVARLAEPRALLSPYASRTFRRKPLVLGFPTPGFLNPTVTGTLDHPDIPLSGSASPHKLGHTGFS